jgi:hypothetical protein
MFTIHAARASFRPIVAAWIALPLLSTATDAARADTCTQPVACPSSAPGQSTLPPKPNTL